MSGIDCDSFAFSGHAIRRMFERAITVEQVTEAISNGEIIMNYPDDQPYPSALALGYADDRALHVVLAREPAGLCQIITAYWPDPAIWSDDFKTRRQPL